MQANDYLTKCIEICNYYESAMKCNECPLYEMSCGLPRTVDEIPYAIEYIQNYETATFPFGRCHQCGKKFNSELANEYEITHCPWCGQKIEKEGEYDIS